MKRFLLFIFAFLSHNIVFGQAGLGPIQNCTQSIPEICNGALYPAATSGSAIAAGASFDCGGYQVDENASFYYFESSTNGPLNIDLTPTDVIGIPDQNIDLDFICWGPFNDLTTMCSQLTATNQEDCSYLSNTVTVTENINITNAVAGEFYVVVVSNWAPSGTNPNPCYIQFTSAGVSDAFGGALPGSAGGTVGVPTPLLFCDSDPVINLFDQLNGQPMNGGTWSFNGNPIAGTFDPAIDPTGTYTYFIPGTVNCPSDEAYVGVDVFSASSISITSPSVICSNENAFTLTGIPAVGWSIGGGFGEFTDNLGSVITDFDPASNGPGIHNITYTYTPQGCNPIPVGGSILVNEAPIVLPANVIITNPSCFGYSDGTAIIVPTGGLPPYVPNWYGQNPLQLSSGTFNYTITDANQCTYNDAVSLADPLNTTSTVNEYNSSCFGENDGAASITMLGGVTPPGTVSTLSYCPSNPSPDFIAQLASNIEEVELTGDNFNILNNTAGSNDFYEDYTATMYADITEGQNYTINITLNDLSGFGIYTSGAKVFIDFNIDGDFDDFGEDVGFIPETTPLGTSFPISFIVPTTGFFGATRMRVVSQDNLGGMIASNIGPCDAPLPGSWGMPWFGATEDYSIVLNSASTSGTFLWDNGSTADSISNLGPGTYSVIITVEGCPIQDFAVISEPAEIMFNPNITGISCNTFTDGTVTLNPSGGNGGTYNINWGSANPLSLGAGTYSVTVSDPSTITSLNTVACENDTTIIMIEPAYFSVDFTTSSNEICLNEPVTLDFDFNQGGVSPYTINYTANALAQVAGPINNTGVNNITISPSLGNNTYIITNIVDANGCFNQNNIFSQDIYVNPLPDINIAVAPNPICFGDNATLLFSAPNGTAPFVVDYLAGGVVGTENVPGAGANVQVNPITTTTYELTSVTDSKGCTSTLSDNTTLIVNEIPQVTLNSTSETCDGDLIQLNFNFTSGIAPWVVNYSINGISTVIPISNAIDSISITPSSQTVYTINSVTDNNNCINNIAQTITINTNPLPEIELSGGGSICADGSTTEVIFTTTSGTPPYNLNYSAGLNSNFVSNIGNIYTVTTNQTGSYSIQDLTDSKGCKAISITGNAYVNVNPLPNANISAYPQPADIVNPLIHFTDASTGHINGLWNFADGTTETSNFDDLVHIYGDTGTYQVSLEIESDSGCTDVAWQTIIISPVFTIYVPSAFTPNNDLNNDYFLPIVDGVKEYEFSVYNRLGQRVFSTDKTNFGWDGKEENSNKYATKGVYVYALTITDLNGKLRTYEGAVTLIR